MDSPGEILSLCRLCLVKDQVNIPIFDEQGDIRQIFLKISSCLPVTITRHDQLPKRICDACSNKLDLLYEFWNSSASAEKTLLSWLGQAGVKDAGKKISAVAQQIAKPAETLVKEESESLEDSHMINESQDSFEDQSLDEGTKDEAEAPPPKRARRTAAVKAQINITPESDEDEDDDFDAGEAMTKIEDESDESESELKDDPSYSEVPGTSADDQAGPSGVGKDGVEAPGCPKEEFIELEEPKLSEEENLLTRIKFECHSCDYTLANKRKLDQHLHLSHSSGMPFKCSLCEKYFNTSASLTVHVKNIHNSERNYKCEVCKKVIRNKRYFELHLQGHKKNYNFFCDHCDRGFIYKHQCKWHIEVMHNSDPQVFVCDMCGKKFSIASYLKRHQARVHQEPRQNSSKSTECKICNKSYRRIKRHYREYHSGEGATYMCDLCGQKFRQSFELKLHMMRHKGEKPNKCSYEGCMKSFVRKQHLLLHMRSHTGEKPYECTVCGNRYTQKPSLVVHMRGHVGEKPYQCDLCWSKFASKQRLNIHQRKVHKLVVVLGKKKLDS